MRALRTLVAVAALAGCSGPSSPYPPGWLSYGFPSPPYAVYQIADTVAVDLKTAGANVEMAGGYALTLDLVFESDPGGVRVRGIAESLEGSLSGPGQATISADLGYLAGALDFVIDRRGVVEVTSVPEISGPASLVFSLAGLPYSLFPHLPDSVVDPGGTWADTVRWHTDGEEAEVTDRSAYTYTLVGDTLIEAGGLVRISVAGQVDIETITGVPGKLTTRHVKGPATGFILWDPESRLVTYHQYQRDLEGTVTRPNRPPLGMSLAGTVRIRLMR